MSIPSYSVLNFTIFIGCGIHTLLKSNQLDSYACFVEKALEAKSYYQHTHISHKTSRENHRHAASWLERRIAFFFTRKSKDQNAYFVTTLRTKYNAEC